MSKLEGLWAICCSVGADIESRRGKAVKDTVENITCSRYKAAMSCGGGTLEQESSQRTAGQRRGSRTSNVSMICQHEMIVGDRCTR